MRKKYGLVLDCDGTCTPKSYGSLYKVVDENALPDAAKPEYEALRNRYLPRVYNGTLEPLDELHWLKETLDIYVRHGLTRDDWQEALRGVQLRVGILDLIGVALQAKIPIAVVSYSVADFIEYVFRRAGISASIDVIHAARLRHDAAGRVIGYEDDSFVYPDNKGEWSKKFADKHGIPIENILAIGDSGADRQLGGLKANRLGIAKDEKNKAQMTKFFGEIVITDDLLPAAQWLQNRLQNS